MSVHSENKNFYYMKVTRLWNYIMGNVSTAVTMGVVTATDCFTFKQNRLHHGKGDLFVVGLVQVGVTLVLLILLHRGPVIPGLLLFPSFVSHFSGT